MRWWIPAVVGCVSLWIGLKIARVETPAPESKGGDSSEPVMRSATISRGPLISAPVGTPAEDYAKDSSGNVDRLSALKRRLEELLGVREELAKKLLMDPSEELKEKRKKLEEFRLRLKSGIGADGNEPSGAEEREWIFQKARDLVDANQQLSRLEAEIHRVKVENRSRPTQELEATLARLKELSLIHI